MEIAVLMQLEVTIALMKMEMETGMEPQINLMTTKESKKAKESI